MWVFSFTGKRPYMGTTGILVLLYRDSHIPRINILVKEMPKKNTLLLLPTLILPARVSVFSRIFSVKTGIIGLLALIATRANPALWPHSTG